MERCCLIICLLLSSQLGASEKYRRMPDSVFTDEQEDIRAFSSVLHPRTQHIVEDKEELLFDFDDDSTYIINGSQSSPLQVTRHKTIRLDTDSVMQPLTIKRADNAVVPIIMSHKEPHFYTFADLRLNTNTLSQVINSFVVKAPAGAMLIVIQKLACIFDLSNKNVLLHSVVIEHRAVSGSGSTTKVFFKDSLANKHYCAIWNAQTQRLEQWIQLTSDACNATKERLVREFVGVRS